MDIQAFLSSGTTHVHTKEPQGNFAKSAKAVVLALAMGVGSTAATTASAEQAQSVQQMPYDGNSVSMLYQALIAPEADSEMRVVSTRSSSVVAMLQAMPKHIQDGLNNSPDLISSAVRELDNSPFANSVGVKWDSWVSKGVESVCLVNALESVTDQAKHVNGAPYSNLAEMTLPGDPLAELSAMTVSEAAQITMIHELAHCEYNLKIEVEPTGDPLDTVFQTAFGEAAADLAVVLYYASQEGSFQNGRVAVGAIRGASNNGDHSTLDMIDEVLAHLDPADFKGMPINKVFQSISPIMNDAWHNHGEVMRAKFLQEVVEGELISGRLAGDTDSLTLKAEDLANLEKLSPNFTYNAYARAHDKIDQVLDYGLRNPDFQRQLGMITVEKLNSAANKLGVQLTPEQLIKGRFLDPAFSPPGTKGDVGLASAAGLREVNYLQELNAQARQNMEKHIVSAPRFN